MGPYSKLHKRPKTGGPLDFKRKCGNPTVGCGMSESPNPRNPTDPSWIPQSENSGLSDNLWYQFFLFWRYQIIWIQTCLDKNLSSFCQGRFVSKLFDIFKTKNLVPQIIAQRWISVLRDSGRICGILEIWRFWHPTAHCGIPACSFEVARAPCKKTYLFFKRDPAIHWGVYSSAWSWSCAIT